MRTFKVPTNFKQNDTRLKVYEYHRRGDPTRVELYLGLSQHRSSEV